MERDFKIRIIDRLDNKHKALDTKAFCLMAIDTFIIGSFLLGYKNLIDLIVCNQIFMFKITLIVVLSLALASILVTILTVTAFFDLSDGHSGKHSSMLNFEDITSGSKQNFRNRIALLTEAQLDDDINDHIYQLATRLYRKRFFIKLAYAFNLIQLLFFIPLIISIIV
jgi:hypothetical protein